MIDDMRFMPAWHGLCRICTDEAEAPDLESGGFDYSPNNPGAFYARVAWIVPDLHRRSRSARS